MTNTTPPHVVVLGAGYAGMTAANLIATRTDASVTLINERDVFQERMRNHQLAVGRRRADIPLQRLVRGRGITLLIGRAVHIDLGTRQVDLAGRAEPIRYDILVYALGSRADVHEVPGVAEHAVAVATADQAGRVPALLARSGGEPVTVVGGGLTGIETVTEIAEAHPDRTVSLLTSTPPGSMLNERAQQHLFATFDRLGVRLVTNSRVAKVAQDGLLLDNGDQLPGRTVVWTAGFAVPPLAQQAGLAVDHRGRMLVDRSMRSLSHPEVYGIGDAAAARNEDDQLVRMGCGPGGLSAAAGARSIANRLVGRSPAQLRYHDVAWHITLGRHDGIVQLGQADGRVITGRVAARIKDRLVLPGAVWGTRHVIAAEAAARRY
ncbi:NAD(P)/FAD-dependent oxidoreductase [Propionibacteriaceae bacterium Y2011]|uniref:NAD(P)/FAD-dependent oxidoreductase n=1 Tax=Microlunatus sp. Y2014 TaxID=3418488 RepID=UPI003B45FE40